MQTNINPRIHPAMYSALDAEKYNRLGLGSNIYQPASTDYLVVKELPSIIDDVGHTTKTLDFGCGAGLSTRFIKSLGRNCIGIDISKEMLVRAKNNDMPGQYIHAAQNHNLPFQTSSFGMAVSIFVMFELPTIESLKKVFSEIYRILKPGGFFIVVTGSEELYNRNWLTLDTSVNQNKRPKSGDICKIRLTSIDLTLEDYYWTDSDYCSVAKATGFNICEKRFPLGTAEDDISWKDELFYSPYAFYKFKKL